MNYTQNRKIMQVTETTLVVGWISAANGITQERSTGEKLNLRAKCFASAMIWMGI